MRAMLLEVVCRVAQSQFFVSLTTQRAYHIDCTLFPFTFIMYHVTLCQYKINLVACLFLYVLLHKFTHAYTAEVKLALEHKPSTPMSHMKLLGQT